MVAEVVRSGFVEGRHHGSVVALGPAGEVLLECGEVRAPMFPRSCNKPLQAAAMVRHGLRLEPRLLALACGSHSGEGFHIDGVRRILAGAGLTEQVLQTPADWPLDEDARDAVVREWGDKAPVLMNCSGKHAAMLATCMANSWDVEGYLDADHPVQRAITETFAELTGEPVAAVGVDGCGAPVLGSTLVGLARAFSRIALARPDTAEGRVATAIRAHPRMVSGTTRDESALLEAVPGAVGKGGAEGCYAVALADGRSVAVKIDDGAYRARPVVMATALQALGVESRVLAEQSRSVLLGGDRPVGEVRPVPW